MPRRSHLLSAGVLALVFGSALGLVSLSRARERAQLFDSASRGFAMAAELTVEGVAQGYFNWTELYELVERDEVGMANRLLLGAPGEFRYVLSVRVEEGEPPHEPWLFEAEGSTLEAVFPVADSYFERVSLRYRGRLRLDAQGIIEGVRLERKIRLLEEGGRPFALGLRAQPAAPALDFLDLLVALAAGLAAAIPLWFTYRRTERFFYESKGLETIIFLFEHAERFSANHSRNVARLAAFLGQAAGLRGRRLRDLYAAALLHDIGKISVPFEILTKQGPLEPAEREVVQAHPAASARVLAGFPELEHLAEFVLRHHERMDGSGYPGGLRGEALSLESRVIAVCDVFEALTGERPYRAPLGERKAIETMSGMGLDTGLLALLSARIGELGDYRLPKWALDFEPGTR